MRSRSETSVSALERLRADVDAVAGLLAAGRAALPTLAMGTDAEGLVHVGMDRRGDVVRLDLDRQWRETIPASALGGAVSEALQQAEQVRTGDWAAAVAAGYPGPRGAARAVDAAAPAAERAGRIAVGRDANGPLVMIEPAWTEHATDESVRTELLAALTAPPVQPAPASARPVEVRALAQHTREALMTSAAALPAFMRAPIHSAVDRVHDDVGHALSLPLASEGVASGELGAYAAALQRCQQRANRPAGLPEAADEWVSSASALAVGLAELRTGRPLRSRLRRRASA